jgi:hypothetical protein
MNETERLKLMRQLRIVQNWKPELNKIARKTGLHYKTVKRFYDQRVKAGGVLLTVELLSDENILSLQEEEDDEQD